MANVELTNLTPASDLTLGDGLYIVQGGNSRYATFEDVKNMMGEGYVYISDLATYAESSSVTITGGVRTLLSIDGAGPETNTTYGGLKGTTVASWWNTSTNAHISSNVGESYTWRLDLKLKKDTAASNDYLVIEQDIGGGVGTITSRSVPMVKGQGVAQYVSLSWGGFALDTFLANGAKFYLTPDSDIDIWDIGLFIRRDFVPNVP